MVACFIQNMMKKYSILDKQLWDATIPKIFELIKSSKIEGQKNSSQLTRGSLFDMSSLSKVVLVRRSRLEIEGNIDSLKLE